MASLEQNIKQAIADFDSIKAAIEESGLVVPDGTDTKEYAAFVNFIVKNSGSPFTVLYVPQALTAEQQEQVRKNIGAITKSDLPNWATQDTKPTYTASEVGAAEKSHTHTADELGITLEETDPTVPAWAKKSTKPTYTASEVGAQKEVVWEGIFANDGNATIAVENCKSYGVYNSIPLTSLSITSWPLTMFDCYLRFTTGDTITVTFPSDAKFAGGVPTFEPNKEYEMLIKDKVVIAVEVVTE